MLLSNDPDALTNPWSQQVDSLQIAWDSTSMSKLQECPLKYRLSIIEGWRSKKDSPALTFGILIHKAFEIYHNLRASGANHKEAQRETVKWCMNAGKVLIGVNENAKKPDNARTRFTLARAVSWYLEQFEHDAAETYILANGKAAVELSFRVSLDLTSPDGIPYLWCGHIDRVARFADDLMVSDYKTTAYALSDNWFRKFGTSNQMSGYLFGARVILPEEPVNQVMIDGIQVLVNSNRYQRGFTKRLPIQLDEWVFNTQQWIRLAEMFAAEQFWPQNFESCDKYGGCPFMDICSMAPAGRKTWLHGDFKVERWNPLKSRET